MAGGSAIARLFVRLGMDKGEFDAGAVSAKQQTAALTSELTNATSAAGLMQGAMAAAGIAGLAALAAEAGKTAFMLATMGTAAARIGDALTRVASAAGQSGDAIAAAMVKATNATMDDEAMMQTATKGMIMGLKLTEQQWAELAAGAKYHARLIGEDAQSVFSGMVESISRGQPRMLAALSFPGAKDAIAALGDEMDQSASSMSEAERQAALLALAFKLVKDEAAQYGPMTADLIDANDALKVSWDNLKESLGEKLAPGLTESVSGLNNLINLDFSPFLTNLARSAAQGNILDKALLQLITGNGNFIAALAASEKATQDANNVNEPYIANLKAVGAVMRTGTAAGDAYAASLRGVDQAAYFKNLKAAAAQINALRKSMTDSKADMDELRGAMYAGDLFAGAGDAAVQLAILREQERKDNEQLAQDTAKANEDAAAKSQKAWEDAASAQKAAYEDFRSTIEAALQPTQVTAVDMGLASTGQYVEKWDEAARQLDAIAARGFSELAAHADWAAVLKIPPEVLAGGEEALKAWASQTADAVRGLTRPDLLNLDAAVATVEQYMRDAAAKETTIDLVANAMVAKGLLSPEEAKAQVAQALGLGGEAVQLPVQVVMQGAGGEALPAGELAKSLFTSFKTSAGEYDFVSALTAGWDTEIKNSEAKLKTTGEAIGGYLWDGLLDRLSGSGIVDHIIAEVLAALADETED